MEQQNAVQPFSFSPSHIYLNQSISSKKRGLEFISHIVEEALGIPAQEVFHGFIQRERLGCTKMRGGIAIPHVKLPYDFETLFICLQLEKPIDFDSLDSQPIDLIFAFIFSEKNAATNKQQLLDFIPKVDDKVLCKQLKNATTTQAFYQILNDALTQDTSINIDQA